MAPWLLMEGNGGGRVVSTPTPHDGWSHPGWIRPFQRVNHPKAGKHGGRGTQKNDG